MINLLKNELDKLNAFSTPLPSSIYDLASIVPDTRLDQKMKLTIAISEIMLFISQFRRNILHFNTSLIPINAITFIISPSGIGKDSSINMIRKAFKLGYDEINDIREAKAIQKAIATATNKKKAHPDNPEVYLPYYEKPYPLFASPSTNEGFIAHLNRLDNDGIGAGYIYSGEFASELSSSNVLIPNLRLLSELYDEGKKEVKMLKDKSNQSEEIINLPVSGMFMSSPDNILYEDNTKKQFKVEFTSKLARRSFFCYNPKALDFPEYSTINELLKDTYEKENIAKEKILNFTTLHKNLAIKQLNKVGEPIPISESCRRVLILYRDYNNRRAEEVKRQYPITKLVIQHMYWKALKLAGALALYKNKDEITDLEYKEAIGFCEILASDMKNFEIELIKEPYELFVSLVHDSLDNNECFIGLHTLKKMGYIIGSNSITSKLKELVTLASSYDESGIYTAEENGIKFKKIIKTNLIGISFLKCSGTKEERSKKCANGFTYNEDLTFAMLADMLKNDYAYTPFKFRNGIRSNANIEGAFKWLAFDIDDSMFSDSEMHELLADLNHHIVRTSNPDNPYKFRLLLELDAPVSLDDRAYKLFVKSIAEYLSIKVDVLPRSQIYFSYKGRTIYSVTDRYSLETRDHLLVALNNSEDNVVETVYLNDKQKKALIDNPRSTFYYAYEATQGAGSISLIKAAHHAKDLGMSKDEVIELMNDINTYWTYPMDNTRLQNTIIKQIEKWNFNDT